MPFFACRLFSISLIKGPSLLTRTSLCLNSENQHQIDHTTTLPTVGSRNRIVHTPLLSLFGCHGCLSLNKNDARVRVCLCERELGAATTVVWQVVPV